MSMLSLGIPPQGTSIGKGYPKMTPYTVMVSRPYPGVTPSPPLGGRWGDLTDTKSMLLLLMVHKRAGRQVDSKLRALDSLAESLPIG